MVEPCFVQDAFAADHLRCALDIVADRLEAACSARAFLAALDANHALWTRIRDAAPRLGWTISPKALDFALGVSARRQVGDGEVATLVRLNRRLARSIAANYDAHTGAGFRHSPPLPANGMMGAGTTMADSAGNGTG